MSLHSILTLLMACSVVNIINLVNTWPVISWGVIGLQSHINYIKSTTNLVTNISYCLCTVKLANYLKSKLYTGGNKNKYYDEFHLHIQYIQVNISNIIESSVDLINFNK